MLLPKPAGAASLVFLFAPLSAQAVELDGRLAVQHRVLAALGGPLVVHRASGPGVVLGVRGSGREPVRARLELARTALPSRPDAAMNARLSVGRQRALGPLRFGSRLVLSGESLGTAEAWTGAADLAPRLGALDWAATGGLRLRAGPTRVAVTAGVDVLGVVARPGTTRPDPEVLGSTGQGLEVPAALSVSGPWNDLAVVLDAQASWELGPGELVASVSTRMERLDIGQLERRLTVVQPELGWRFGTPQRPPPPARRRVAPPQWVPVPFDPPPLSEPAPEPAPEPVEPVEPAEPVEPVEPVEAAEPVERGAPVEPVEPVERGAPVEPPGPPVPPMAPEPPPPR